jgi:hypothetical protein
LIYLVSQAEWKETRVARLGEFSPIGRLLTLGSFLKIKEAEKCFGLLSSKLKIRVNFDKEWIGQHLGIFLQTHLVTLKDTYICTSVGKVRISPWAFG